MSLRGLAPVLQRGLTLRCLIGPPRLRKHPPEEIPAGETAVELNLKCSTGVSPVSAPVTQPARWSAAKQWAIATLAMDGRPRVAEAAPGGGAFSRGTGVSPVSAPVAQRAGLSAAKEMAGKCGTGVSPVSAPATQRARLSAAKDHNPHYCITHGIPWVSSWGLGAGGPIITNARPVCSAIVKSVPEPESRHL